MFRFITNVVSKRPACKRAARRPSSTRLGAEALEGRDLMAVLGSTFPTLVIPDAAGNTAAAAQVVTLPAMQQKTVSDYLPSTADVDFYRVDLNQGDFLEADFGSTGTAALDGTLAVLNSSGAVIAQTGGTLSPFIASHGNPSVGMYAPQTGSYFLRMTTTAADPTVQRSYALNVERVAVEEFAQTNTGLAQGGAYHAWLNQAGDTLNVTGPTGYGFSLRGSWTQTAASGTVTYAAAGTLYLKTTALSGTVGEVPLQVAKGETFTVTTNVSGRAQLGELASVGGHFGLSLSPVAGVIKDRFGLDVSSTSLMSGWTIKTGAQVKHDYLSAVSHDLGQMLDGVPYLAYGDTAQVNLQFGGLSVTTTDQSSTVLIADPADPFLYVGYQNYAAAGSVHGRIPFNTSVSLPSLPSTSAIPAPANLAGNYGHVYAAGAFPLSGVPLTVAGDVTVNLDANGDGQLLGGAGNASQLFRGDLTALDAVVRDINVGVNGSVNLGYKVGGFNVSVPLGQASVFYSGPQQAVFFEGTQGTAMNTWAGTPLANFQVGPGAAIEGYAYRDGRFSVATTSNYRFFTADAALTITVTDHDISARGTLTTPIASADVVGTIGFDGVVNWSGTAHVGIGGGDNFIRGDAAFVLTANQAGMTFDVNLNCQSRLSLSGVKAEGTMTGHLKVIVDSAGHVTYDVGSLGFVGGVYTYNPFTHGWNKVASVSAAVSLNGKHLSFSANGYGFSLDLP